VAAADQIDHDLQHMSDHDVIIREAVVDDAIAMGRLHVRAWQHAYRGVMPDEYLDGLQPDERVTMWAGRIGRADLPPVLVAVADGGVGGFAALGAEEPPTSPSCGELYAINLDPDHWGRGIGRALLHRVTQALIDLGYDEAVLWVVPENARARALYESEGWVADGGRATEEILGVTVTDIRYRRPLVQRHEAPDE
jgi:GNAT superfamily N-acetyltransferase